MKQDEEGWTEKAAGLLGWRGMSSVALGARGGLPAERGYMGRGSEDWEAGPGGQAPSPPAS